MTQFSNIALYIYTIRNMGLFTTNKEFHSKFQTIDDLRDYVMHNKSLKLNAEMVREELINNRTIDGIISCFDNEFPTLNIDIPKQDVPVLLFYRGNISLLSNVQDNIAVIGSRQVDNSIIKREQAIIKRIAQCNLNCNIISGLAIGCDTVAHQSALDNNLKTTAILSTSLDYIYPSENKLLAHRIVENNGLLITEYNDYNKSEFIKRLIDRDRLQAMFAHSVIACAGKAKSGTRHAMNAANKYGKRALVMYNDTIDNTNDNFSLARGLIKTNKTSVLTNNNLKQICSNSPHIISCSNDIFTLNVDAIVNPVNCVGVMGKGLALSFKQNFPNNYIYYNNKCSNGDVKIGKMLKYVDNNKTIINFPTKEHWKDNSKIEYIESGLDDLIDLVNSDNFRSIAIPALGAGLGGLEWEPVKLLLLEKLSNIHKSITIYIIEPK